MLRRAAGEETWVQESEDQIAIRALVAEWMAATKRGDNEAVLDLITDDAVFLVAGQPPMDKRAFASASRARPGERPTFDAVSDIQEIHVEGSTAYMWSKLTVTITPPGAAPIHRAGHTLTVFRKARGRWRLARDANLLVRV
jgi:uncharacterized protein (TIGR02246 family)